MECHAKKIDGKRCKANALHGRNFCFRHDRAVKEKAIEASSKGGRSRRQYNELGTPLVLKSPKDIKTLMESAINSLWTGRMPSNNPAGGLGYLAKIFLESYSMSELERRIELMEERMDEAKI